MKTWVGEREGLRKKKGGGVKYNKRSHETRNLIRSIHLLASLLSPLFDIVVKIMFAKKRYFYPIKIFSVLPLWFKKIHVLRRLSIDIIKQGRKIADQ